MNILAIDTTTKMASVSLKKDSIILSNSINNEITHSEKLLPLIDKTLKEACLKLNNIDKFALINGPGSFTGIRIGLATIKAFSHVLKKDIFSLSSLELIALSTYINKNITEEKYIISMIDAKNDRIYYSIYKLKLKENKIVISKLLDIKNDIIDIALEIIKEVLIKNNIDINLCIFAGSLNEDEKSLLSKYTFDMVYPTTRDLILAMNKIRNLENYTFNAFDLKAIYARPSQAERVRNGEK